MSAVTLPGAGQNVATRLDGFGDHVQEVAVIECDLETLRSLRDLMGVLGSITDPVTGRVRISLDAIAGSLTLATVTTVGTVTTVTTVSTVTNQAQLGGVPANSAVLDIMNSAYLLGARRTIT